MKMATDLLRYIFVIYSICFHIFQIYISDCIYLYIFSIF
uniref:Uncharacterized protein n=1 Tax=Anguilla anguilla TaxID=7936 RepID=A0A0E9WKS1_ANGAN